MRKARKTRTRRLRRSARMKQRSGGGVRRHASPSGRTGSVRSKQLSGGHQ